jgi:hypothetical protein
MTRARVAAAALLVWVVVLALALQPHHNRPPRITHSSPLDVPIRDLPTLAPRQR